jgi:predicted outer membrane repeat protein
MNLSRMNAIAAAIAVGGALELVASPASATYEISSAQASVTYAPNDGQCSLWEAIQSLNAGLVNPGEGLYGCVNDFEGGNGIVLQGQGDAHFLTGGATIWEPMVIWSMTFPPANLESVGQVLDVAPGARLDLSYVNVQHVGTSIGRVINNLGELHLLEVLILNGNVQGLPNDAGCGGGIYNGGTLDILRSTIRNNKAVRGGGICNVGSGGVTLDSSTVSSNTATGNGGGFYSSVRLQIVSSTISSNTATGNGGGIYHQDPGNTGYTTLLASTVAFNTAAQGGGVHVGTSKATVTDYSVVGKNRRPNGTADDYFGNPHGQFFRPDENRDKFSMFGTRTGIPTAGQSPYDLVGDPRLNSLAFNGGPTKTHALQSTSPAKGVSRSCPAQDQRGSPRPSTLCDLGAFELP